MKKWYILYVVGNLLLASATFIPLYGIKKGQVFYFLLMFFLSTCGLWKLRQKDLVKNKNKD